MKLHLSGLLVLLCLSTFPAADISAQERQTQLRGPKDATRQYSGAVYGPIDEQDTLWRIAQRYRQDRSLSMYQVMQAIYELNPDAFEQQNRNLLVEGATLRLPSRRYTARIDTEQARANAEADDKQYTELLKQPASASNNIKPPEPLVKKSDLSDTRTAIEQQITRLDKQQIQQFDELRQQFAASLNNVQQMLDENRKLYDRVEQVNTDLMSLRQQVEGDVQRQMDEQLALQRELLSMVKKDQAARQAEQQSGIVSTLTQPVSLIIGSGILTLLLAGGLAAWLLRNREDDAPLNQPQNEAEPPPAPATEDIASSISADIEDDTPELSDDELFNDDELLDDVLSSELEDTLDAELDNFSDDMLVPDDNEQIFEDGDSELGQGDLDSLFDDEDMDTVELSEEVDDVDPTTQDEAVTDTPKDTPRPAPSEPPVSEDDFTVNTDDAGLANDSSVEDSDLPPITAASVDNDEQPEISIDELLEAEQAKTEKSFVTENDAVDDDMLGKLDDEINQQNAELDRLADGILEEIDQLEQMGGLPTAEDIEREELENSAPSAQGIQDLDAFADDLDDIELDDVENGDNFADPLSDELIAQLQAENDFEEESPEAESVAGFDDPLSDELLEELNAEQDDSEEQLDALSEELLAELGAGYDDNEAGDSEVSPHEQTDQDEELTDDLLAELEAGISAEDDRDQQPEAGSESGIVDAEPEAMATEDVADEDIDALLDSIADDEAQAAPAPANTLDSTDESPDENANVSADDSPDQDANEEAADQETLEPEATEADATNGDTGAEAIANEDIANEDMADEDIDALLDSMADDEAQAAPAPANTLDSTDESSDENTNVSADDSPDQDANEEAADQETLESEATEADATDGDNGAEAMANEAMADEDIDALLDSMADDEAQAAPVPANTLDSTDESPDENANVSADDSPDQDANEEAAVQETLESEATEADATDGGNGAEAMAAEDIDALLDSMADDEEQSEPASADSAASEALDSEPVSETSGLAMADEDIEALLDSMGDDDTQSAPETDSPSGSAEHSEDGEPASEISDNHTGQSGENVGETLEEARDESLGDTVDKSADNSADTDTSEQDTTPENGVADNKVEESEPARETAGPVMADEDIETLLDSMGDEEAQPEPVPDNSADSDTTSSAEGEPEAVRDGGQANETTDGEGLVQDEAVEEDVTNHEASESEAAEQTTGQDMADEDIDALFESMEEDPGQQAAPKPEEVASSEDAAEELFNELEQFDESEEVFAGEPALEFEDDEDDFTSEEPVPAQEAVAAPEETSSVQVDPLDSALAEFDQQLMEDIPSFTDGAPRSDSEFDDSILAEFDDAPEFALEQEDDGVIPSVQPGRGDINELEDVPGLDDWLSDAKGTDKDIFDELEGSDFDDLLDGMGGEPSEATAESKTPGEPDETERRFKEQNPDLDLSALLNEPDDLISSKTEETDYLTVESLLDDTLQDEGNQFEEMPLDLDVSLSDYSGISDDADIIDIDKDAGQSANLDLARVYMEMDDMSTARELLEDVIKNGSEEQQKEASDLLATLV